MAQHSGADSVYPGYGFLSENPELARACEEAGITFIGPPARVLALAGNKVAAKQQAEAAGIPVLASAGPWDNVDDLVVAGPEIGFPLFVKAAAGGGGRGLRRVAGPHELRAAVEAATREAATAFGDPTVFLEAAVEGARHVEVQVLADGAGDVVHLFERDCSVQRRHQKVVEIAPAPNLDRSIRERLWADGVKFARAVGYLNAGTVEFLVAPDGRYVFIEMNPRIQVEHTVTEEVTAIDIVQAQLQIGGRRQPGGPRHRPGGHRGDGYGSSVPDHDRGPGSELPPGHRPGHHLPFSRRVRRTPRRLHICRGGRVPAFRLPARQAYVPRPDLPGRGSAGQAGGGRVQGPRCGHQYPFSPGRAGRPGLRGEGRVTTSFIETHPQLLTARATGDRGTRLLTYLADVTVNRPYGTAPVTADPTLKLPPLGSPAAPIQRGSRDLLLELGP